MPIPFGVGVGDFIAVGKLIGQISVELRENGEAAPEYQSLVLELEALGRALHQLDALEPTQHELLQLRAIRATALTCQRPLQDFLSKISKFEGTMGIFNIKSNRFKGFPRRIQWRMMFKEDVKEIRTVLASHVATINLLLMTQTIGSLTAAERDQERLQNELGAKILSHRRQLDNVQEGIEVTIQKQLETKLQLQDLSTALDNLDAKSNQNNFQLRDQQASLRDVKALASTTQVQTTSILSTTTSIMALMTSGLINLQQIAEQVVKMFQLCAAFTTEMRVAIANLTQLFLNLHTILRRIELALPIRVYLPIVQFTDALGYTMALPYQLCQQWTIFKELLGVIFLNKPGKSRVDAGLYRIMQNKGGRLLLESSWQHAIKPDDHLSMSIVVDELEAMAGYCPFPSCQSCLTSIEVTNGGRTCTICGRWALSKPRRQIEDPESVWLDQDVYSEEETDMNHEYVDDDEYDEAGDTQLTCLSSEADEDKEDIEVFRQIHVLTSELRRPSSPLHEAPTSSQTQLTNEEFRNLLKGYLRYGAIEDREYDILHHAGLEGRDIKILKQSIADVRNEAYRHLNFHHNRQKRRKGLKILFDYRSLTALDALAIIERPMQMRWLSEFFSFRLDNTSSFVYYQGYAPQWRREEDAAVLLSVHTHGYGAWSEIKRDIKFDGIYVGWRLEQNSDSTWIKSFKIKNPARRFHYLLGMKTASEARKKLLLSR